MMKKSFLLFNLFPLMSALSLLSCGTNEQTDVFYKISYESSNLYTILNLPEAAKEGEDIYFDVDSNCVFYTVGKMLVLMMKLLIRVNMVTYLKCLLKMLKLKLQWILLMNTTTQTIIYFGEVLLMGLYQL